MKIPFGKIAAWLGQIVLAAAAQAVVDRLSVPRRPVTDEVEINRP